MAAAQRGPKIARLRFCLTWAISHALPRSPAAPFFGAHPPSPLHVSCVHVSMWLGLLDFGLVALGPPISAEFLGGSRSVSSCSFVWGMWGGGCGFWELKPGVVHTHTWHLAALGGWVQWIACWCCHTTQNNQTRNPEIPRPPLGGGQNCFTVGLPGCSLPTQGRQGPHVATVVELAT